MNRSFPLNAWYAAAWSRDIGRELVPQIIGGRNLVFYRTAAGAPVCLDDACWHRLVPLSKGRLVGDEVQCPYHGLRFDCAGRCTHMPGQPTLNPTARVRSYPIVDKHRFLWVWLGDPLLADLNKVPDVSLNDHPDWAGDGDRINARCNYRLVLDNLLDLTHVAYVHASTIGGEAVNDAEVQTVHSEDGVTVTRWMFDIDAPPAYRELLGKPGNVDRWQIIRYRAPSTVCIEVGVALTGTGARQGNRSDCFSLTGINLITPATESTCHYFWAHARNYDIASDATTQMLKERARGIFEEDREILELQQEAFDRLERPAYDLKIDAGGLWARTAIKKMVLNESN